MTLVVALQLLPHFYLIHCNSGAKLLSDSTLVRKEKLRDKFKKNPKDFHTCLEMFYGDCIQRSLLYQSGHSAGSRLFRNTFPLVCFQLSSLLYVRPYSLLTSLMIVRTLGCACYCFFFLDNNLNKKLNTVGRCAINGGKHFQGA